MPAWKMGCGYQRVGRFSVTGCGLDVEYPMEGSQLSVPSKVLSGALQKALFYTLAYVRSFYRKLTGCNGLQS